MTEHILALLGLSLAGSLLAGVLFLLKPLLRGRVSRAAAYYLWLLVLLRLCVPVGLTLPLPEAPAPAPVQASTTQQPVASGQTPPATSTSPEATQPNQSDLAPGPTPEPAPKGNPLPTLLFALWAAGAVGVGGWYVTGYLRVRRTIHRTARPAGQEAQAILAALEPRGHVQLVESPAVGSPLLLGLFRPVIVLPVGLTDPARLRDILSHELTHVRRYDLLVKWFAALAASIHWFNPLLILVRREISRACELACDEAVVKALDAPARKHYGETLLLLAAEAPMGALPLAVTLCEEKKTLQERLVSIVKVQKPTPAALLLTLVLVLVLGVCALFRGMEQAKEPRSLTDPESGMTIHLDMTREEVEALLGPGMLQYESSTAQGTERCFVHNTEAGALRIRYEEEQVVVIDAVSEYFLSGTTSTVSSPFRWTTEAGISYGSAMEDVQKEYRRWPVQALFQEGNDTVFSCQGSTDEKKDSFWLYIRAGEDACVEAMTLQRTYAPPTPPPTGFSNPSTGAQVELYQTRAEIEERLGPGKDMSNEPFRFPTYIEDEQGNIQQWDPEDAPEERENAGEIHREVYHYEAGEDGGNAEKDRGNAGIIDSKGYDYEVSQGLQDTLPRTAVGDGLFPGFSVFCYGEGADTLYVHYRQDVAIAFSTIYITDYTADPKEALHPFHWQLDGLTYGSTSEDAQRVYPEGLLTDCGNQMGLNVQLFQYYNRVSQLDLGIYNGTMGSMSLMVAYPG